MDVIGSRILLRPLTVDDAEEFVSLAVASADFHRPWLYPPTSAEEFADYLERFDAPDACGFVLRLAASREIVGYVNVSQIVHGSYQRGVLGFGIFLPHDRRGYMSEGLGLVIRHAFEVLGLHRLEAEIQPANKKSQHLVEGLGFVREGFSPGLIRIRGAWTDHERWALTRV